MNKKRVVIIMCSLIVVLGLISGIAFAKEEGDWCVITTYVENGQIDSARRVKVGSNVIIKTKAEEGYELKSVYVDGAKAELTGESITNIEVLMNTVDAFYSRGEDAQYDNGLRENYISPYQQGIFYTDCSGFTFASYYNAFGIEIPTSTKLLDAYARTNANTEYVIEYMDYATYQANVDRIFEAISGKLEKGDLLTIRTDAGKGHTMMVYDFQKEKDGTINDVIIIHSTGRNYEHESHPCDYDKTFTEGTIRKASMKQRFAERYSGENIVSFSVIRPLAISGLFLDDSGNLETYSSMESCAYYIFQNVTENHQLMVLYKEGSFYKMKGVRMDGTTPLEHIDNLIS